MADFFETYWKAMNLLWDYGERAYPWNVASVWSLVKERQ